MQPPKACVDESVIVKGRGTIYLAGPPLVAAATGEKVSAEELGGGEMHTRVSGVADQLAESEEQGCEMAREIVERIRDLTRVKDGFLILAGAVNTAFFCPTSVL